jgi:hypothetical protein
VAPDTIRRLSGVHGPSWYVLGWLVRRAYLTGPTKSVEVMTVFVADADEPRGGAAADRLAEALSLIRRGDPRRFARLLRDGVRIAFTTQFGRAQYWRSVNVIALDLQKVIDRPLSLLASSIVHEATHARLARSGIVSRRAATARIERRCVEEEIAFMRRLPHSSEALFEQWTAQKRDSLALHWWTRRAGARAGAAALEREGGPAWLLWLACRLS